ncbi:MAG: outer membrane protein assembly factor BamA [Melioribacteraceae bacterium]|nr:outer membrane protein assembly factor BamA [Melioribacteraceae bacterium]MCF8354933.1 outer membrane protein assembly factor BamA [Melioribacteraceae bacterium]MCF8392378.1 outer membrane protein assembly factor BamA [Melioribacteraceae bacterium]MCF8417898.1 outer membrane protein assembly factor BamA [Melioribacteraceae bacterium]
MTKSFPTKWLIFSFVLILSFNQVNYSQVQRANYKILGISVEGSTSADPSTIIANSGLRIGNEIEIPGDETSKAIRRLWSLNIFSDIQIEIEKEIDNGVFLLIKVKEYPRIEDTVLEGWDEVDEDDIMEKINFVRGQILKPQDIYRVKMNILQLYEEEGYLNAEVTAKQFEFFSSDTTDDDEITVTWRNVNDLSEEHETTYEFDPDLPYNTLKKVNERILLMYDMVEGDEITVNEIRFVGNDAFEDDDLKSEFDETEESTWWKFWSSANFKREDFEKDKELLTDFYRENGYRDFRVMGDTLLYSEDKSEVDILLSVFEGPQYKVRNISWIGNTVYKDAVLNERLGFLSGDIYDYKKFNQNLRGNEAQTDVAALYLDNGYLTFNLETHEKKIAEDSLDIEIKISENNRFKIGRVEVTGNTKTKGKVIRRELYTIPGDYFSRSMIFRSIQQLANLQYFNVEQLYQTGVDYRPANDSTVNLVYNVEEKSSDYLNASIGYSGSFGFSGAIGITLTNFSIAEPFQLGGGQILNFSWQFGVGNYYRTFTLGFTEPWFMDTPTLVGFDVFDTRQRYVYDLRQSGGTVKVGRRLKWPDNYFYIQGLFRFQYNDVIDGRNFYREGISRQYTIGATISRTDIDNPIFPSRGSKISLNGELSGGPVMPGDVDYYKIEFKADWYKRLFNSNRLALYAGMEMGYLDELTSGTAVQPFEYFFMGGNGLIIATTPLRGYDDRSIGPRSSRGDIIGGRVMTKYTVELRGALALEPIPIYLLTFAEAGNIFYNMQQADLFKLRRSVGFGARILINPIGLIGFDFGYGFDRPEVDGQDPQWQFHFQFGRGF